MGRAPPSPKRVRPQPDDRDRRLRDGAGMGKTYCEQDCRSFLPLLPRNDELQSVWAIQMGDALLTFGEQDKRVASPGAPSQSSRACPGPLSSTTLYNPQGTPGFRIFFGQTCSGVTRQAGMPRQLIAMSLSERSVPPRGPAWHSCLV